MRGHKRKLSAASIWMFLIGLGGQTHVHFFGSIGISELPIFFLAPIIFFQDFHQLRRDGFMPWIGLAILTCVGCLISAWANDIYFIFKKDGEVKRDVVENKIKLLEKSFKGNFPGSLTEDFIKDSLVNAEFSFLNDSTHISVLSSVPSDKSEDYIKVMMVI